MQWGCLDKKPNEVGASGLGWKPRGREQCARCGVETKDQQVAHVAYLRLVSLARGGER